MSTIDRFTPAFYTNVMSTGRDLNTRTQISDSNLPHASLLKRLMALSYDLLILMALSMAYWAAATFIMVAILNTEDRGEYLPMQTGYWFETGWVLAIVGFYWFFWMRGGQTIGMRSWRLKIISCGHQKLTHRQCLLRIAVAPLSIAFAGVGYLWCLTNKEKAAWQDLASNTRVVVTPKTP